MAPHTVAVVVNVTVVVDVEFVGAEKEKKEKKLIHPSVHP